MAALAQLGAVIGHDTGDSPQAIPPPKAPLKPNTDRPTLDLPSQDRPSAAAPEVGRSSEEGEWTKVTPPRTAEGSSLPNDPTSTAKTQENPNDTPQKSAPADPGVADPTTNPPTHYNRLEPFPPPHKAHAAATATPAAAGKDTLPPPPSKGDDETVRAQDPLQDTAQQSTGSPWHRLATTAGPSDLAPQISTPPAHELRSSPTLGAAARAVPRLTPPAPPPKDALDPIVSSEFKDEMGNVKPDPRYSDSRAEAHVPPAERAALMPSQLAEVPTEEEGVTITQLSEKSARDPGLKDVGWNAHVDDVPQPVVGGVTNDRLWMLVRRFDKQMYHVKAVPDEKVVGPLDLQVAEEEEFSPDKLRANLERLYVSVIISLMAFVKHIMRLRSWNEPRRTGAWLAVYVAAWAADLVLPTILGLVLVLIVFPPARAALFPPAPLALVSSKTGNLQTPRAGTLATGDTLTGAPENHAGEAAEQEATNFVNGFASLAVGTALGKHPDGDADERSDPADQPVDKSLPDPSNLGTTALDAKQTAQGAGMERDKDKTKQPMEVAIWTQARPAMRALTGVADTWEMMGNALSPTKPFGHGARWKLAGVVGALVGAMAVTSNEVLNKVVAAGVGFGFFGQPLIDRGLAYLNTNYPGWERQLDLRNSLLLGVPTNAQLTLTLLRIGEANKSPLPPPPITKEAPSDEPDEPVVKHEDLPSDLQNSAEVEETPAPEEAPDVAHGEGAKKTTKHKVMSKLGGLLKGGAKAGVSGVLGADRVKANLGSEHAKQRLGIIPPKEGEELVDGPSVFEGRVRGKRGHVVISTSATTPCVSWVALGSKKGKTGEWEAEWSILLSDISEMRKVGGLGWKGKLVVGWAYEREVYDGLEIVDVKGAKWVVTAMKRRDELFNRLVALVGHKWEAW